MKTQRKLRSGFARTEVAVFIGSLLVVGAVWAVFFGSTRPRLRFSRCAENLHTFYFSMMQYSQDHGGRLPYAGTKTTDQGWASALRPYTGSTETYHCPESPSFNPTSWQTDPQRMHFTDYWFNRHLSGLSPRTLEYPDHTLLMGEGNDGRDDTTARYALSHLPLTWRADPRSPAYRHEGRFFVLCIDGRLRRLPPDQIVHSPRLGPSFAIR